MGKDRIGAALALVLASMVGLVGVVQAVNEGISEPQTISLSNVETSALSFTLENTEGDEATIGLNRDALVDADGNAVGDHYWSCLATGLAWYCTSIISLLDGPYTDEGTVALAGLFAGFNGESFAVTGGTGAYANVRGTATLTTGDAGFTRTLELIP